MSGGLDMMFALVLEDGRRWGEVAADFQVEDAEAIFSNDGPRLHYLTRGRGGSKTTDVAGIALSWLAMEAPPRSRGYVVAANADQAAEVIDAAASLIYRTPELDGIVTAEAERLVGPEEAWVRVMPASESGAWGKRDAHLLVCDEFAQWPQTRGAKRVYTAVRTTVQKTPGCRLVNLTSAGEPSHWSYDVLQQAYKDPASWHVHEVPGPVPWQSPEALASLRRDLLASTGPSAYTRLILNKWTAAEDRLVTPEDLEAAMVLKGTVPPQPGRSYVIGLDLGLKDDPTVLAICHGEPIYDEDQTSLVGTRVVLDKMRVWKGSRKRPVSMQAVERAVFDEVHTYNGARVVADPWNTEEMSQRLRGRGVMWDQYPFGPGSIARLAYALYNQLRNRMMLLPKDEELASELLNVRMKETAVPGQRRLDHEPGQHDDRAIALALATEAIIGRPEWDFDGVYTPIDAQAAHPDPLDPWAATYAPPDASNPFSFVAAVPETMPQRVDPALAQSRYGRVA